VTPDTRSALRNWSVTDDPDLPAWHQALAYAVTGCRLDGLGRQALPDPLVLAEVLRERGLSTGSSFAPVPPELMRGLGPAQFSAALAQLRSALAPAHPAAPVLADRPLTSDERRLLTDVPPHHGV